MSSTTSKPATKPAKPIVAPASVTLAVYREALANQSKGDALVSKVLKVSRTHGLKGQGIMVDAAYVTRLALLSGIIGTTDKPVDKADPRTKSVREYATEAGISPTYVILLRRLGAALAECDVQPVFNPEGELPSDWQILASKAFANKPIVAKVLDSTKPNAKALQVAIGKVFDRKTGKAKTAKQEGQAPTGEQRTEKDVATVTADASPMDACITAIAVLAQSMPNLTREDRAKVEAAVERCIAKVISDATKTERQRKAEQNSNRSGRTGTAKPRESRPIGTPVLTAEQADKVLQTA